MELTKLLTSAHPEKIRHGGGRGTGDQSLCDRRFPPGIPGLRERMAGAASGPEPFSCLALLPPEESMRWAAFLRHMEPDMCAPDPEGP